MFNSFKIHPVSFINALSKALELSSVGISEHHRRTAIIANHIGIKMGLGQNELQVLIYASLLHDIGAAANWDEKHFIIHDDKDKLVFKHAEEGYSILKDSEQLGILAEPIRYHHDRFCGGNPSGFVGDEIPLLSRIIHIADRVEVQITKSEHIFIQRDRIMENMEINDFFDSEIIAVLKNLSQIEYFWLNIINSDYMNSFMKNLDFFEKRSFDLSDMIVIAEIFSKIIDATSHFTATHSKNVANVTRALAIIQGFCNKEADQFYLAGLLHDLGKLAIPNEILNKPGKLSKIECEIVKQHPYYSYTILNEVDGFKNIASWVGAHHETLDGNGYPFRLNASEICLGCRILATADIYCALVESRPYGNGVSNEIALNTMDQMVKAEKIDNKIVHALRINSAFFYPLIKKGVTETPLLILS